jgi:hypothetical protein
MADAAAALQAQITAAVTAALAAQAATAAPVAHVAVKLPDFWVKDPKCARITAETIMYDYCAANFSFAQLAKTMSS